jgi:hypothetical protein
LILTAKVPKWTSLLPPHLTALTAKLTHLESLEGLPETLIKLNLSLFAAGDFNPSSLAKLAVGLQDLTIRNYDSIANYHISLLPRGLKQLYLSSKLLNGDCFKNMPPTLIRLILDNLNGRLVPDACSCLPRTLTKLSILNMSSIEEECIGMIPRNVTELGL